jgi:hypothetical protein
VAIAIRMSMTESTETLTLYQMSIMTLCIAGLLTLGCRAPYWGDALMVALAEVGNGIAQFWWTRSLSLAPNDQLDFFVSRTRARRGTKNSADEDQDHIREGTEGSNLASSSGGSVSPPHPLSKVENPAFRAGVRGWLGWPGSKELFLRNPPNRGLLIGGKALGARHDEARRHCRHWHHGHGDDAQPRKGRLRGRRL